MVGITESFKVILSHFIMCKKHCTLLVKQSITTIKVSGCMHSNVHAC